MRSYDVRVGRAAGQPVKGPRLTFEPPVLVPVLGGFSAGGGDCFVVFVALEKSGMPALRGIVGGGTFVRPGCGGGCARPGLAPAPDPVVMEIAERQICAHYRRYILYVPRVEKTPEVITPQRCQTSYY